MLQSDLTKAQNAVNYLADTATFNINTVTSFVVIAKAPKVGSVQQPAVTIVVDSGSQVFAGMKTAFGNAITAKRAAAQALLDSLEVTEG